MAVAEEYAISDLEALCSRSGGREMPVSCSGCPDKTTLIRVAVLHTAAPSVPRLGSFRCSSASMIGLAIRMIKYHDGSYNCCHLDRSRIMASTAGLSSMYLHHFIRSLDFFDELLPVRRLISPSTSCLALSRRRRRMSSISSWFARRSGCMLGNACWRNFIYPSVRSSNDLT
jgi:hypothetical protein